MHKPLVTIGMPAYNNEATIARAIGSVLAQTRTDWILRVSDDGSSDGTLDAALAAAGGDSRIVVGRRPERRMFMNFGDLLAGATTPYFAWLAADDFWATRFLAECIAVLEARPEAVSALPRTAFVGKKDEPGTETLDGPVPDRLRRYLAHPGGTRMYGLGRTKVLQASFPRRNMNAYDWYLMLGLLREGPQIEVPQVLLYREQTDWMRYAEMADELYSTRLLRRFPVLDMSLAALRAGFVPPSVLWALVRLNCRKHAEYLAVVRPAEFSRRIRLFRALGLRLARPDVVPYLASSLIRRDPVRREPALKVLRHEVARGNADAARVLDELHRDGFDTGDAGQGDAAARLLHKAPESAPPRRPSAPVALPDLTAVLTCRNAAATLGGQLDHLASVGAKVIMIDHGSTDATWAIASARRDAPVAELLWEPFDGVFDLSRQLRRKRQIIGSIRSGWVLHADADEFVESPDGTPLRTWLARQGAEVLAVPCRELAFLPHREDEHHEPQSFQRTMRQYVPISEHDPKQRLFRCDAPLDLWLRTGGHTLTLDATRLAPEAAVLRHYVGLSLDHLRAQYLGRVFARDEVARLWHGTRMAAIRYDVVPPPSDLLRTLGDEGPATPEAQRHLPVFRMRLGGEAAPTDAEPADLAIVAGQSRALERLLDEIRRIYPGLRLSIGAELPAAAIAASIPVLQVFEHPVAFAPIECSDPDMRAIASEWLRRAAATRQLALAPAVAYGEIRVEDGAGPVEETVRRLLLRGGPRPPEAFLRPDQLVKRADFRGPLRTITGNFARDLGYA